MSLFLFTSSFPYGYGEGFLEDEIPFLAKAFDHIVIVPFWAPNTSSYRSLPHNFELLKPTIVGRTRNNLKGLIPSKVTPLFILEFFQARVYSNRLRVSNWLKTLFYSNCILHSSTVKQIEKRLHSDDICYFYWGVGLNVLSAVWKGKAKLVSRFHATSDLWEDKRDNYTALRQKIAKALDLAIFISQKGEDYFKQRYPYCNTYVSRLGAHNVGISKRSSDGKLRVLSCSNVIPLKRVDLICRSLASIPDFDIVWTHIGSGGELEKIRDLANSLSSSRFHAIFTGQISHDEVIRYFCENEIDLFINLSKSEGIPASIIEAISFNVPCIATNVGATSEVVTSETGILLPADPEISEVVSAVSRINEGSFSPKNYWSQFYDSDNNYSKLTEILKNI